MMNPVIEAMQSATPQQLQEAMAECLVMFQPYGIDSFPKLKAEFEALHAYKQSRLLAEAQQKQQKELSEQKAVAVKLLNDAGMRDGKGQPLTESAAIVDAYLALPQERRGAFVAEHTSVSLGGTPAGSEVKPVTPNSVPEAKRAEVKESVKKLLVQTH